MKRILVFSESVFYYDALRTICGSISSRICIVSVNQYSKVNNDDLIIFLINDFSILQCSEFYLRNCIEIPCGSVLCIGTERGCKVTNRITGNSSAMVDIRSSVEAIKNEIYCFILKITKVPRHVEQKSNVTLYEVSVIRMLTMGYSLSEIAILKHRSLKTVSAHKCNFFKKLGLENRVGILLNFIR